VLPRVDRGALGAVLSLRVQPRAKRNAFAGLHGEALKLAVTSPPVDGEANRAVVEFLAKACGVPKTSLRLVRGETGRDKAVEFTSLEPEELRERLRALLSP
jgi:uncharacterized protein (TIGR00251 family)